MEWDGTKWKRIGITFIVELARIEMCPLELHLGSCFCNVPLRSNVVCKDFRHPQEQKAINKRIESDELDQAVEAIMSDDAGTAGDPEINPEIEIALEMPVAFLKNIS